MTVTLKQNRAQIEQPTYMYMYIPAYMCICRPNVCECVLLEVHFVKCVTVLLLSGSEEIELTVCPSLSPLLSLSPLSSSLRVSQGAHRVLSLQHLTLPTPCVAMATVNTGSNDRDHPNSSPVGSPYPPSPRPPYSPIPYVSLHTL